MNGFIVTIRLKDCAIDSKEYTRLDELMELGNLCTSSASSV
jgi:hypothetical protein